MSRFLDNSAAVLVALPLIIACGSVLATVLGGGAAG